MYQISEAAALSGLTVRALRHYDAIGLLQPATRSDAGYRLYGNEDVKALQRIRRYQGFGFSLDEIGELLTAKAPDRLEALRNQRDAVRQRTSDTAQVVRAINQEITKENNGEKERPTDGSVPKHSSANTGTGPGPSLFRAFRHCSLTLWTYCVPSPRPSRWTPMR
ncbi:MAG: MerR family transcriptional regulator [Gammaproteobacteria bacterium]|nr:MerR family transcriptional regulator [Gammaproteobacteria bacterium]